MCSISVCVPKLDSCVFHSFSLGSFKVMYGQVRNDLRVSVSTTLHAALAEQFRPPGVFGSGVRAEGSVEIPRVQLSFHAVFNDVCTKRIAPGTRAWKSRIRLPQRGGCEQVGTSTSYNTY